MSVETGCEKTSKKDFEPRKVPYFMEMTVNSALGGGFPPDHLYWQRNGSPGSFLSEMQFSGLWKQLDSERCCAQREGTASRTYTWTTTTKGNVDEKAAFSDKIVASADGKRYRVVGFRNCGSTEIYENVPSYRNIYQHDTVVHKLNYYTIVVEILQEK